MEFRLLGPLEVLEEGRAVPLRRRLSRALLAYLLLHVDEPISPDRLVNELWGAEPPRTARASLQNQVSELRKTLGPERVSREPAGYVLRIDADDFDLARFQQLVSEARMVDDRRRAKKLRTALELWRGPPLADLSFEPFAQEAIRWLEETRLAVLERRIETDLALGAHQELVSELEALVAEHPLRESLRFQLMIALYRSGRQAEALAEYQTAYRTLEELGIEPSDDLRRLERDILRHEPALRVVTEDRGEITPKGSAASSRGKTRKPVTALICGLVEATALAHRTDPEVFERVLSRRFDEIRTVITRHGGTAEQFGDGTVLGIFGVPLVHDDDALRAVRAAEQIRALSPSEASVGSDARPPPRIGISTGVVLASESLEPGPLVAGAAVSDAANLERAAKPGEILVSDTTWRLVRHAVQAQPSELTSEGDNLIAWYLNRIVLDSAPVPRHLDAPLIGRGDELARLQELFEATRNTGAPHLVTVLGVAGIGKTRLVTEFVSGLVDGAMVLTGRCVPYGEGITFWSLKEMFHDIADPDLEARIIATDGLRERQAVATHIGAALGLIDLTATADEQASWAFRRLFEALARQQPLVLVFEDIHWGEAGLLDLVEDLVDLARAPILCLGVARLELLEARPDWRVGKPNSHLLRLGPLPDEQTRELLANLPGSRSVSESAKGAVIQSAEGNALFAEQMLAMLQEDPSVAELPETNLTIEAILAARLDRLGPGERAVLQAASIIGKEFSTRPLSELLPKEARPTVDRHLKTLTQKEFVRFDRHANAQSGDLRFRHALVWDSTYRAMPKTRRADLHERFGDWLERTSGNRLIEREEVIGHHLEQAYCLLAELGPIEDKADRLARRAAAYLTSSGQRAARRGDDRAVANLLGRAASLLPSNDPSRLQFIDLLGMALQMIGEYEHADALLTEAIELATGQGDGAVEARARVQRWWSHFHLGRPEGSADCAESEARKAIPVFEALGDELHLAKAWYLRAVADQMRCRTADAEAACEQAILHANKAGDHNLAAYIAAELVQAMEYSPTPVIEALGRCEEMTERVRTDPLAVAKMFTARSNLAAMRGRFDEARALVADAQAIVEELHIARGAYGAGMARRRAQIELRAGKPVAAEQVLRPVHDTLLQRGDKADKRSLATVATMLAETTYAQGRYTDAAQFSQLAGAVMVPDSPAEEARWRGIQARLLAREGEFAAAEEFAREAVGLVEATDLLNDRADRLIDLVEVLQLAGSRFEAVSSALGEALSLYEQKGNIVSAAKVRALIDEAAKVLS
jgi:DNA-binding SARP family transcriptional activator